MDETHAMTLRLPDDVYERLRMAAFKRRTSQTAIIREALEVRLAEIEAQDARDAA